MGGQTYEQRQYTNKQSKLTTISNNNSTYEKGKLVVRVAAVASVAFVIVPILGKVMVVPRVIIAAVVAVIALTAVILMVISEMACRDPALLRVPGGFRVEG